MAVSTKSLESVYDVIAAKGIPDPRNQSQGYSDKLTLRIADSVMADLITERFNWKFNRAVAAPFYTNSYQQDYPQPAQAGGPIAWGESCDICDINNTQLPKPLNVDGEVIWAQELPRTSASARRPNRISWMYNDQLSWGTWPGAGVKFYPLVGITAPAGQNPIMNFQDVHGNYLILVGFGTTGNAAPSLPAGSAEGLTVVDGTCTWSVVAAKSQGFRIDVLPGSTALTWQITPSYQLEPPTFKTLAQLLTPIPDSFSRHFERGLQAECVLASPNPGDRQRFPETREQWLMSLDKIKQQANKSPGVFGLVPASSPVEDRWGGWRPRTVCDPV